LADKATPEIHGEQLVGATEASNEVILEGSDRLFGGIAVVRVRRYKLEFNAIGVEKLFEAMRGFIVQLL
jgi:hypothetical protein